MTLPPLPDTPCLRVNLDYKWVDSSLSGGRFYLSYAGSAGSAGDLGTLASDISSQWNTSIAGLCCPDVSLVEVDVLDIATRTGLSAQSAAIHAGTRSGAVLPQDVAFNVEWGIARRYRGGKPRMYWPMGTQPDLVDTAHWLSTFVTTVGTDVTAFFTAINALSIGGLGALQHVNLSYYEGFHNVTDTSGRTYPRPLYRTPNAVHDDVKSYIPKALVSSQRRRRTATTY
jgi:hypothetical protein